MIQLWRDIPGFEGAYQVSDDGAVRSLARRIVRSNGVPQTFKGRLIRSRNRGGYRMVSLAKAGVLTDHLVHRLVMLSFVGAQPELCEVAHWNGDKADNRLANLRWATRKENAADSARLGQKALGEQKGNAKLSADKVKAIRERYKRSSYGVSNCGELAAEYGVTPSLIIQVVARRIWAHI